MSIFGSSYGALEAVNSITLTDTYSGGTSALRDFVKSICPQSGFYIVILKDSWLRSTSNGLLDMAFVRDGTQISYCFRTIRNSTTIEMKFGWDDANTAVSAYAGDTYEIYKCIGA